MGLASDKQLRANQENALMGGVKTVEGKAVVRFNARKHGILGNLISEYEKGFYNQILDQLIDEFAPSTAIETILVERIAIYYLRLQRLAKAENELIKSCLDRAKYNDSFLSDVLEGRDNSKVKPGDIGQLHALYLRYETAIENRLYRALKELLDYRNKKI